MTADFDRTAHCQYNHQCLTEIQRFLTEHFWLCFDRTTSLTEHFGKLGFDRTVNGKMFCQKDALLGEFCHILPIMGPRIPKMRLNLTMVKLVILLKS